MVERILHNASILFERTFESAQELNRYRKELTGALAQRVGDKIGTSLNPQPALQLTPT